VAQKEMVERSFLVIITARCATLGLLMMVNGLGLGEYNTNRVELVTETFK